MATERVSFTGHDGSELAGNLELPDGSPKACALFAHCFTCSKDVFAATRIARGLAERGIAVLRFDFTGLGRSEGEFADTSFSSNIQDLLAAGEFMRTRADAPSLLIGHSLGGAAVLRAASEIPECLAVCTIGAPADPGHVRHLLGDSEAELLDKGEGVVDIGGRPFRVRREFIDDLTRYSCLDTIGDLRRALLVFHSPTDQTVGIENAADIFGAAKHPKSFVSLDGADHLLTDRRDAEFVASVLASWAARYAFGPAD